MVGKVLLCSECFSEIGGGSCAEHPDDPPIDPDKPEVRDLLADRDYEALARLRRRFMGIGAIPGALTLIGGVALHVASGFVFPRGIVGGAFSVVTAAGLTIGRLLANRRFKPRYVRWTGHDYRMDDDIENMLGKSGGP